MSKTTRELDTTELAQALGLERTNFVKNRVRIEKKLKDQGYIFEKQGARANIRYLFKEGQHISPLYPKNKIQEIFQIRTNGRDKTMDLYLQYILQNPKDFIWKTDLEIAEEVGDHRPNISTVRAILEKEGYITFGESKYFKEVGGIGSGIWDEITPELWKFNWSFYYYPHKELVLTSGAKYGDGRVANEQDAHRIALRFMEDELGYRMSSRRERILSFEFLRRLELYSND